jgi:hypothetical protein
LNYFQTNATISDAMHEMETTMNIPAVDPWKAPRSVKATRTLLAVCALSSTMLQLAKAGAPTVITETAVSSTTELPPPDLLRAESTFTSTGSYRDKSFGHSDSSDVDITYSHRFHLQDNWYLRAGAEYERFGFGGTANGLPSQLQSVSASLALQYMVRNHVAMGVEIHPGFYFQNNIRSDSFDIPWRIYTGLPIVDRKFYIVIGAAGAMNQHPPVLPVGGFVWIWTDKLRLEAVVPKPAIVYEPNKQWEFRLGGEIAGGDYRTDNLLIGNTNVRLNNAIVQYVEYRTGVKAAYTGFKHVELSVGAGYSLGRQMNFYRVGFQANTDGGAYGQLACAIKF